MEPNNLNDLRLYDSAIDLVEEAGDGGGYDWDVTKFFYNTKTNLLAAGHSAGCSCDGWSDYFFKFSDLEVIPNKEALRSYVKDMTNITPDYAIELLRKLERYVV